MPATELTMKLLPFAESTVTHEDFEPGHWSVTAPHRACEMVKAL